MKSEITFYDGKSFESWILSNLFLFYDNVLYNVSRVIRNGLLYMFTRIKNVENTYRLKRKTLTNTLTSDQIVL